MKQLRAGAVVAFSGGVDSTTVLFEAIKRYGKENVFAVSFHYGQKHSKELEMAALIADQAGVHWELVELPKIFGGTGSTLIDELQNVQMMDSYAELQKKEGAQPTVVAQRNMNIIAVCGTLAEVHGVNRVMLGVHGTDSANFHYPDCTPEFIGAMAAAMWVSSEYRVHLEAPFNNWSKGQIVAHAATIGAPLHLTQSCYTGVRPQCGQCATCHERIEAFQEAGFIDPAKYAIEVAWSGFSRPFPIGVSWLTKMLIDEEDNGDEHV